MQTPCDAANGATDDGSEHFPALRKLGLGRLELAALARQGHLTSDRSRRDGDGYWRLRFRWAGRTRTVYVGRDRRRVAEVRAELDRLRERRRRDRRTMALAGEGRAVLRATKRRLEPIVGALGYRFHGSTIRKTRCESSGRNE